MGAIFADTIAFIIASVITAVKSTLFWGGDALICGMGNWLANAFTGMLGMFGFGTGGMGVMVGGIGWLPGLIGVISGVGGALINGALNIWSMIEPAMGVGISAVVSCLMGPL